MAGLCKLRYIGLLSFLAALTCSFLPPACAASLSGLTNSVAVGNFTVSYPDGWSTFQSGRLTFIINVPADKQATLGSQFLFTPQVNISIEQRVDNDDALRRLNDLAAGAGVSVTRLTVGGSPAIQWRKTTPWPQPGGQTPSTSSTALTISTAIAAGSQLIRLDGSLPSDAPSAIADAVVAIETSVTFSSGSSSAAGSAANSMLVEAQGLAGTVIRRIRGFQRQLAREFWPGQSTAMADDEGDENDMPPPVGEGGDTGPSAPGAATRIIINNLGQPIAEPEVATSTNGRDIVVAQQFDWTWSNDGGQTFTFGGNFPNSTGGDSSLAVGQSGDFYEATIFNNTTAIHRSTNGGQTFAVRGTAFTCGMGQCNFTGGSFPDQEHIAADPANAGDRVYNVFRDGFASPKWGITCSTDGGATWPNNNVGLAGDFPRVTVAADGSVYVAYVEGSNMMIDKFAGCAANMPEAAGFPKTVATGVNVVTCPVPGLDRCNNGNDLRSPTAAVDDTSSSHIFYAYATNTGAGNENVLVRDSTDNGATWSNPTTLNGGGTARRFMPWMCATKGTAYVTWYDRRNVTGSADDLTDYFG
ncbi:MAG: hypothetical protein ACLQU2_32770, partial [Candidatus Binataceae bacterium]